MPFTKFTNLNFDQIKESVKDYLVGLTLILKILTLKGQIWRL